MERSRLLQCSAGVEDVSHILYIGLIKAGKVKIKGHNFLPVRYILDSDELEFLFNSSCWKRETELIC